MITPQKQNIIIGSKTSLTCQTNGSTTLWFINSLFTRSICSGNKLEINNVSLRDGGIYFCYRRNSLDNKHLIAAASLEVYGKCLECVLTLRSTNAL